MFTPASLEPIVTQCKAKIAYRPDDTAGGLLAVAPVARFFTHEELDREKSGDYRRATCPRPTLLARWQETKQW
jgi:hypothetical protein